MIYGIQRTSFVDCSGCPSFGIPPSICTVLFFGGCNLRCPYCHNKDIVYKTSKEFEIEYVFELLLSRKHLIDWICISGGEPTIYKNELKDFLKSLKTMGFHIKLDTNGTSPSVLEHIQEFVDYIALDVKAIDYKLCEDKDGFSKLIKSISLLSKAKKPFLLRTTFYPPFVGEHFVRYILNVLMDLNVKNIDWYFNPFDNKHVLKEEAKVYDSTTKEDIENLLKDITPPPSVHFYW